MEKQIKILLCILITVMFTKNVSAQVGYEDVVYLKNGSVIHGIIVEQVPNVSVKIQTKSKDVFVFKMEEIEKITKERKEMGRGPVREKEKEPESSDIKKDPYTGYVLSIESQIGESAIQNDAQRGVFSTHVVNGIMFNNMFSAGVGIGFDYFTANNNYNYNINNSNVNYYYYDHEYLVMPYYIDLRAHPIKGKISPLVILDFGYSAALFTDHVAGGIMFNAGVGAKLNITRRLGLNMSLNYKAQRFSYSGDQYNYNTYQSTYGSGSFTLQHICLTFGITL